MPAPRTFSQKPFKGPAGSTELLLVRHGASADAIEGAPFALVGGHGDPPLSEVGLRQAELVAQRLMREEFEAIYVSNLRRTAQTAAPLAARSGLTPVVETDLREVFLGQWEGGLIRQKVADRDPLALRVFAEQRWDVVPGAEPAAAFRARLRDAVGRIAAAHVDSRVVVFSHAAAIGQIIAQASGAEPFAFTTADNASITRLIAAPDRWYVRGYNEITHLMD
ncbi:MAG TPA: histidine phosphatase family protein [Acidimicrobiales bacterium]|nr:histidine phosphatase family protein [Acidimicrobiales bacterium]